MLLLTSIGYILFNTLRPRQCGPLFPDDIFKYIFLNENILIAIKIWLLFFPKLRINNIPALVQIMAWHRPGDNPLSQPMMVSFLIYICITWLRWVNSCCGEFILGNIKLYLDFLHTDVVQVFDILPPARQGLPYPTFSAMSADDLVRTGARASAGMVLIPSCSI